MTAPTSYNSGHTATLRYAQIRQSRTSYVCKTLCEIRLGGWQYTFISKDFYIQKVAINKVIVLYYKK